MSRKEYFAYGSNLNFEQMAYRCPEATLVGTAKLDGYELAFRRGYLTVLPKEGASVEGLIWSVTDHDESQLDCYEGYPMEDAAYACRLGPGDDLGPVVGKLFAVEMRMCIYECCHQYWRFIIRSA